MQFNPYYQYLLFAAVLLVAVPGCATSLERDPWLKLPSPWSTVKQTPPRSALAASLDEPQADKKTASKKATSKSKKGKEESAVALAMLNGLNCERSGEWDKAREVYEQIRKEHPDNLEAIHRLGIVADAMRRHMEAEQIFLFVLEKEPRNAEVLADLGYCYYLQGQLTKAESALAKATKLEPANQRYRNNLGLVLGHERRYEEALDCFRKCGSEADAQYNLAFVYAGQDRPADAKRCFQTALAIDPTHRRAREALSSFDEYERLPKHLRDIEDVADDDVRYVPYIEGGSGDSGVATAGHETAATSFTASRAAHALHQEARGMLGRNMASQRADDAAGP
jgi:tetratricopeptide (TPR) repeat protein